MAEKKKTTKKTNRTNKVRITEQEKLQANNLLEQASDIMNNCIRCGKCKSLSPIIKATKQEHLGPRGQAILIGEKIIDKNIYTNTLCKGAEINCPLHIQIDEAILKAREAAVLKKITTKQNEKMIENLKATGNPYVNNKGEKDTSVIYT